MLFGFMYSVMQTETTGLLHVHEFYCRFIAHFVEKDRQASEKSQEVA